MPEYEVPVTGHARVTVEADNPDEALKKAEEEVDSGEMDTSTDKANDLVLIEDGEEKATVAWGHGEWVVMEDE